MFFQVDTAQPSVQPETIFTLGSLNVTNAMFMGVLVTLVLAFVSFVYANRSTLRPGKFQVILEITVGSFLTLLEQIGGDRIKAQKLLPLVGAIFLFFGLSNLIGLIPGLTSITLSGTPIFRTPTNDFNMTFSIALAVVIISQIGSFKTFGFLGHLGKYIKFKEIFIGFKKGLGSGALAIVDFLIGLLDIVSEIAKVVSLSLRLFGNMYAGEVLAAILLGAFALAVPSTWMAMNILVGFLQAMVFGALTAAYYSLATEKIEESSA